MTAPDATPARGDVDLAGAIGEVRNVLDGYKGAIYTVHSRFDAIVEELDALTAERDALAQRVERLMPLAILAARILYAQQDHGRGDVDGGELQSMAVLSGAMSCVERVVPCAEHCACADYAYHDETVTCYPVTDWPLVKELRNTIRATPTPGARMDEQTFARPSLPSP